LAFISSAYFPIEPNQRPSSSPAAAALRSASCTSLDASPAKLNVVDSRRVAEQETWAHLAVSGHWLIVRELRDLSAWTWREEGAPGEPREFRDSRSAPGNATR